MGAVPLPYIHRFRREMERTRRQLENIGAEIEAL